MLFELTYNYNTDLYMHTQMLYAIVYNELLYFPGQSLYTHQTLNVGGWRVHPSSEQIVSIHQLLNISG